MTEVCTIKQEVRDTIRSLAVEETEALFPIIIEPNIYQYDEHVFVWFDETGGVGGASNYLEEARRQMQAYADRLG